MRCIKPAVIAVILFALLLPARSHAYTYGDANLEDVAETFKLIAASLQGPSPDWKSAEAAHQMRRSEIASHFGEPVASLLDDDFRVNNAEWVLADYKAVLVMNLDRRFTYAKDDITDYTQARLLLAKSRATYETLDPFISDRTVVLEAYTSFDTALEALGNPGLFGVGKKPANPDVFKEQIDSIYSGVKDLFPFTSGMDSDVGTNLPAEPDQHAPMERTKRTNPIVTISIIGCALVIGIVLIIVARKKKWL